MLNNYNIIDLYYYSYCPYYYYNYGIPSKESLVNDIITAMLSRQLLEKAEHCTIENKKLIKLYTNILNNKQFDSIDKTEIEFKYKMMSKNISRLQRYEKILLINSYVDYLGIKINIHGLIKSKYKGKDKFTILIYLYNNTEPSQLQLFNDIRITSTIAYINDNYKGIIEVKILHRDNVYIFRKIHFDIENVKKYIKDLTFSINHDIIYKRIGTWCQRCILYDKCKMSRNSK